MKIFNNNKKPKCKWCGNEIVERRKAKLEDKSYYHISCLYNRATERFNYWRKIKNHLARYKRDMVISKLR